MEIMLSIYTQKEKERDTEREREADRHTDRDKEKERACQSHLHNIHNYRSKEPGYQQFSNLIILTINTYYFH